MKFEWTGYVTGRVHTGDADAIVRLLTRDKGEQSLFVRQARASKRRFAGVFEVGNLVRVQGTQGRGLPRASSGERLSGPRVARESLEHLAVLCYCAEVSGAFGKEGDEAPFLLLQSTLASIESKNPPRAIRQAFETKMLTFSGWLTSLVRCSTCLEPLEEAPVVWTQGPHHGRCSGGGLIDLEQLVALERLRRTPMRDVQTPALSSPLGSVIRELLGKPLASRSLVDDLGV